jgi:hypothetical protein
VTNHQGVAHQRKLAACHERTALEFMSPGLFQSLWVMGHMLGIDIGPDEPLPAFGKRLVTELDELCDLYGIYDDPIGDGPCPQESAQLRPIFRRPSHRSRTSLTRFGTRPATQHRKSCRPTTRTRRSLTCIRRQNRNHQPLRSTMRKPSLTNS